MNLNPKIERQTISMVCFSHYEMCCGKRDSRIDSTLTCEAFKGVESGVKHARLSRVCFA